MGSCVAKPPSTTGPPTGLRSPWACALDRDSLLRRAASPSHVDDPSLGALRCMLDPSTLPTLDAELRLGGSTPIDGPSAPLVTDATLSWCHATTLQHLGVHTAV